jgi:hypothetical protein
VVVANRPDLIATPLIARSNPSGGVNHMGKLAAAVALAIVLGLPNPALAAGWRSKECRYQTLDGHNGWTTTEVKATISCAALRFGINERIAYLVADHESGFQAVTAYDNYCGVYQHARSSFPGRISGAETMWPGYAWFGKRCENARSNIFAAFYLVKVSGGWYAGWCKWAWYC